MMRVFVALAFFVSVAHAQGIAINKDSTLQGTGSSGSPLGVNTSNIQVRVSAACSSGTAIRAIGADGTLICETVGDITSVGATAGGGLTGGATSGPALLSLITTCSDGQVLKSTSGSWSCANDTGGITNSAGTNVVMKADASGNAVASTITDDGTTVGMGARIEFRNNTINGLPTTDSDNQTTIFNYSGFNGGFTRDRNLYVYDGKGAAIATFTGSTKATALAGDLAVAGVLDVNNDLAKFGSTFDGSLYISGGTLNAYYSRDVDGDSLNFNVTGFAGGTTRSRNIGFYDGKGAAGCTFTGSTKTFDCVGGLSTSGTLGVTGLATLTGGFTLGADSSAASHKITNLTNGSSAQDAAAFGQIASGINAAVSVTNNRSVRGTGANTVGAGAWTDDGTNATANGNTDLSPGIATLGQSKGTIQTTTATGTQNNFVINATTSILYWTGTGSASVVFTGFKCGASDCSSADNGRLLWVVAVGNASGWAATISQESASSTAANRTWSVDGSHNITLTPANSSATAAALLMYDGTSTRWRAISVWTNRHDELFNITNAVTALGGITVGAPGVTLSGNGSLAIASGGTGHVLSKQSPITPSSCGTSPTGKATDVGGHVTTGTGATGCVITWSASYQTDAPSCVVTFESGAAGSYTVNVTALTITTGASVTFDYWCSGFNG